MTKFGEADPRWIDKLQKIERLGANHAFKNSSLVFCLLKSQMKNGVPSQGEEKSQFLAQETNGVLTQFVPPAIPGIMFVSGGQTEVESVHNLAQINKEAKYDPTVPWRLSFSFGRALQASVLKIWSDNLNENGIKAQKRVEELAKVNALASNGIVLNQHPSILSENISLKENFRGWSKS